MNSYNVSKYLFAHRGAISKQIKYIKISFLQSLIGIPQKLNYIAYNLIHLLQDVPRKPQPNVKQNFQPHTMTKAGFLL